MRPREVAAVLALLLLGVSGMVSAQNVQVSGVQGVSFGTMLPGVSAIVSRMDGARAATFDIKGSGSGRIVQLQLTLPAALSGPAGATIPLSYGAGDAGFSAQQSIASQIGFDPRLPYTATLTTSGRGSVYVGGTASPAPNQAAGNYSATLTLTVVYL